jgi:hypothetical protein
VISVIRWSGQYHGQWEHCIFEGDHVHSKHRQTSVLPPHESPTLSAAPKSVYCFKLNPSCLQHHPLFAPHCRQAPMLSKPTWTIMVHMKPQVCMWKKDFDGLSEISPSTGQVGTFDKQCVCHLHVVHCFLTFLNPWSDWLIEYLTPLADTIEDHLVNWDLLEMV